MKISQVGIDLIKSFEGYLVKLPDGSCRAYKCPAGVWTIGWGCTEGVKKGDVWSRAKADAKFAEEMRKHFAFVEQQAPWANQNEFDALASFSYNGGPGMLRQLLRRYPDKQKIADAFLLFNRGGGRVLRGLTRRRHAERALFLKPVPRSIVGRYVEKQAEKKAAAKEAAPRASRVDEFLDYIGLGSISFGTILHQLGAFVVDWRTLAVLGAGGSVWLGVKLIKWRAVKARKKFVIPAADGVKGNA